MKELSSEQISILKGLKLNDGMSIFDKSNETLVILLFIKHAGCVFCQRMLKDYSVFLEEKVVEVDFFPVIVHMDDAETGDLLIETYKLSKAHAVSDPVLKVYNIFKLKKGNLWTIFGPLTMLKTLDLILLQGYKQGKATGDAFQLPGLIAINKGKVVNAKYLDTIWEQPNFLNFLKSSSEACELPTLEVLKKT